MQVPWYCPDMWVTDQVLENKGPGLQVENLLSLCVRVRPQE
jgi:hypothetical protein